MRDLTKKQRYWQAHLTALEEFDGNAAEYARLHGSQAKQLYVYKTKLRECAEQASPALQEQARSILALRSPHSIPKIQTSESEVIDDEISLPARWEAAFEAGTVLPACFGSEYCRLFANIRRDECETFHAEISNRDCEWYLRAV